MKNNQISTSAAIVFKDQGKKKLFLIVKQAEDANWELAKVTVRKGESSVRAAIRMTTEQAGMNARVLDETHRVNTTTILNGKSIPQRIYYYLMVLRAVSEVYGFAEHKWVELAKAKSMIDLKREKDALEACKEPLKVWEKTRKTEKEEEEEQALEL